ncbi:Mu-like prophage I protein [Salipiger thiooxidans]|uniref:Mu-like prophage I protein n=1 Tax=Salipiger thiooxidans TaxID=282683 RepID=A0A1G7NCF0_9RHOB|nr:phage protease [Salipiger thiooxidans]SDF71611.1 Mu-like prophage I protein [Salipiger thiooxidans]
MNTALVSLSTILLPAPANGQTVPEWVHLVPKGWVQARDGRGPWHYDAAKAVIAESFSRRQRIHIDENHSTDTAANAHFAAEVPLRLFIPWEQMLNQSRAS